jgi:hypothetical protein
MKFVRISWDRGGVRGAVCVDSNAVLRSNFGDGYQKICFS